MAGPKQQAAESAARIADGAAAASVSLFGLSLSEFNEAVQIVAGIMAIGAAAASIYYHVKRGRQS